MWCALPGLSLVRSGQRVLFLHPERLSWMSVVVRLGNLTPMRRLLRTLRLVRRVCPRRMSVVSRFDVNRQQPPAVNLRDSALTPLAGT
jgi:hypothetical protein